MSSGSCNSQAILAEPVVRGLYGLASICNFWRVRLLHGYGSVRSIFLVTQQLCYAHSIELSEYCCVFCQGDRR